MPQRRRTYTSADGLIARAGRAAEDPYRMTQEATWGKIAKHCAALAAENPDLTPDQIAKGARLRLRAEMAELAKKSVKARTAARPTGPQAA